MWCQSGVGIDGILNLCGIDTVVSGNTSGGLCDLDRVSGGGDTNVSRVDTVVSGDSVSRGVVVRVAGMSLAGGGDTVVSGVDEPMCGDSLVMTAGELDVCACDTLVSYGDGDSSTVEVVGDVLRVVMTSCCLTRFVSVAGCRWLD